MQRDAYDRVAAGADWLSLEEATAAIVAACAPLDGERVGIEVALGRVLTEAVVSTVDLPPWDNSAMDGFAVRAADVRGAAPDSPVRLRVIEAVQAGGFASREVEAGTAIRIMTGAPVPDGADSVIRVEHTRMEAGDVLVFDDGDAARNIRRRGEDVRRDATTLEPGLLLRPAEVGVLASVGRRHVRVTRKPRIAILSTGDELAALDEFADVAAGRRIVDSNSWAIAAAAEMAGAIPFRLGIAADDPASLRERIAAAHDADALVTTAGASVGDHDIVKDVLLELGYQPSFWRVRMRPGSPVSFGMLPRDGAPPLPVFGLPGNPVSALVTWLLLVRPGVRALLGRDDVHVRTLRVRTAEPVASRAGMTHFLRARLERGGDGTLLARLTGPQGSGILTSMAAAEALLVVPETRDGLAAGEATVAVPLGSGDDAASRFELSEL